MAICEGIAEHRLFRCLATGWSCTRIAAQLNSSQGFSEEPLAVKRWRSWCSNVILVDVLHRMHMCTDPSLDTQTLFDGLTLPSPAQGADDAQLNPSGLSTMGIWPSFTLRDDGQDPVMRKEESDDIYGL